MSVSADGLLSGTPLEAGAFPFTITATDAQGCFVSRKYILSVGAICRPIAILPETLADATAGVTYTAQLTASGGAGPDYEFGPENLPCGLKLDPDSGVIILSPPALPFATTGMPYSQMMTASGGTPPYTFSVISGALPPGLALNPATGLISGTPTSSGTYNLTLAATDANGCLGTTGCSITMTVDIPALSGWEIVVLSMLLGTLGLAAMRRLS